MQTTTKTASDMYDGIGGASGSKGGIYFDSGNFRVRVQRVSDKRSEKDGARLFIVETEILAIRNLDPKSELKVGDRPSSVIKFGQYPKLALGNVADFMRAGLSSIHYSNGEAIDPEDVALTSAVAHEISGEDNILVGIELDVYAYKRKKDSDFTTLEWSVPDDIKAKATGGAAKASA